ncbi:hypothetical protein EON67_06290, partial [archaeon]
MSMRDCRFDIIVTSGRMVHLLAKPYFPSLCRVAGPDTRSTVIITEMARNIVSLRSAQQLEFARRVVGMAGNIGALWIGSDRELSADTYAVGSVIAPSSREKSSSGSATT